MVWYPVCGPLVWDSQPCPMIFWRLEASKDTFKGLGTPSGDPRLGTPGLGTHGHLGKMPYVTEEFCPQTFQNYLRTSLRLFQDAACLAVRPCKKYQNGGTPLTSHSWPGHVDLSTIIWFQCQHDLIGPKESCSLDRYRDKQTFPKAATNVYNFWWLLVWQHHIKHGHQVITHGWTIASWVYF